MRAFEVLLGDVPVGTLLDDGRGRSAFQIDEAYRSRPRRPVLGQQFEDGLTETYEGHGGTLPSFFANLVPEGPVRALLARSAGVPAGDDLGLLAAVGTDLPGAVVVRPARFSPESLPAIAFGPPPPPRRREPDGPRLRFSVAGVQMKFSVLRAAERVVLPARDELGAWIVKLDSAEYPGLVENEWATMEWARRAGFDVPECLVRGPEDLPDVIRQVGPRGRPFFLIRRYDRVGGARIHQEDLAQVVGVDPVCKYGRSEEYPDCRPMDYGQLVAVARAVAGPEGYREALRRLALMVGTGNFDAHLKNWSLLYPDGIRPELSPLYDQVAVVAWPHARVGWALDWKGTRGQPKRTRMSAFQEIARRLGESAEEASALVRDTLHALAEAWPSISDLYPDGHGDAIRRYWRTVPALRSVRPRGLP